MTSHMYGCNNTTVWSGTFTRCGCKTTTIAFCRFLPYLAKHVIDNFTAYLTSTDKSTMENLWKISHKPLSNIWHPFICARTKQRFAVMTDDITTQNDTCIKLIVCAENKITKYNISSWIKHNINPRGDQEKSSVAYYSYKNHNFANIGYKNMNDNFNAKIMLYYNKIITSVEQTKIMGIFLFEIN